MMAFLLKNSSIEDQRKVIRFLVAPDFDQTPWYCQKNLIVEIFIGTIGFYNFCLYNVCAMKTEFFFSKFLLISYIEKYKELVPQIILKIFFFCKRGILLGGGYIIIFIWNLRKMWRHCKMLKNNNNKMKKTKQIKNHRLSW